MQCFVRVNGFHLYYLDRPCRCQRTMSEPQVGLNRGDLWATTRASIEWKFLHLICTMPHNCTFSRLWTTLGQLQWRTTKRALSGRSQGKGPLRGRITLITLSLSTRLNSRAVRCAPLRLAFASSSPFSFPLWPSCQASITVVCASFNLFFQFLNNHLCRDFSELF